MARDFALAAGQQAHNQWLSPLRSRLLEDSRQLEVPAQRDMQHLHPSCRSPTPADNCRLLHGHILQPRFPGVQGMDYAMFGVFFSSAECCLILSTTYHLIGSYSHSVEQMWLRMDLLGIVIVTTGTFVPSIYYAFPCHPISQRLYWTIVSHLSPLLAIMFWCLQCTDAETDHRLGMRRCNYDLDTPISTLEDGEDMRLRCSRSLVVHSNAAWNSAIWAQVHAQIFGDEMVFA